MPEYRYKARNFEGKTMTGALQAENEMAFRTMLKEQNLFLLELTVQEMKSERDELSRAKMSSKDLAVFCRQLSSMLVAGVTVIRALDILYQQTDKKM